MYNVTKYTKKTKKCYITACFHPKGNTRKSSVMMPLWHTHLYVRYSSLKNFFTLKKYCYCLP